MVTVRFSVSGNDPRRSMFCVKGEMLRSHQVSCDAGVMVLDLLVQKPHAASLA
jgi:hypothetical protein